MDAYTLRLALRAARRPKLLVRAFQRALYSLARGDAYNIELNGEAALLGALAPLGPMVVLDVGANMGQWSRVARKVFPTADIHAFEASPSTYEALISDSGMASITVHQLGLSDMAALVPLKDFGQGAGATTLITRLTFHDHAASSSVRSVLVQRGSDVCANLNLKHIDLLKIDVEGAELRVLRGFSEMLEKNLIRVIQFEYGYANGDDHVLMRDIYEFFAAFGYIVGRLGRRGVTFRPWRYSDNNFDSGPNYVAIHGRDSESQAILRTF